MMNLVIHMGWEIRKENTLWVTRDPSPIGVVIQQEFGSLDEAVQYIDKREAEKMLYRIRYGKK